MGDLFTKIASFTSRMSVVSEDSIPSRLVPIYQAMLLSLLSICGLGIRITSRDLQPEGKVYDRPSVHRHS